jgi:hypothetical protein
MPAVVASKPVTNKPVTKMKPRQMAEELANLFKNHDAVFARADELKSALKDGATENFKEVFAGIGEVSVSAPKKGKFKGTFPTIVVEEFLALPAPQKTRLVKDGLVTMVDEYGGDYYGAVKVKVF